MRKKGISGKDKTSYWVRTPQAVKRIDKKLGQNYCFLDDDEKGYLRHELLKVRKKDKHNIFIYIYIIYISVLYLS